MSAHVRRLSANAHRFHSTPFLPVTARIENIDSTYVSKSGARTMHDFPDTPSEYTVFIFCLGVFITFFIWLGYICLKYIIPYFQQALHDLEVGRAQRRLEENIQEDVEAFLEAPPRALSRIGTGLGNRISQFLSSLGGRGDNITNWEFDQERQRLISERVVAQRRPIFENSRSVDGQSESLDGATESESSEQTIVYRDDWEQNCGLRRRSWDYV
jgi:hypothetical protein